MSKVIFLLVLILNTFSLFAQPEKIKTDRPGKTNNASTVPKHFIQTETGLQKDIYKFQPIYKDVRYLLPTLLFKYGILNKLEGRFISEYSTEKQENVNGTSYYNGFNNIQIGAKLNFLQQKGVIPQTSLISHFRYNRLVKNNSFADTINGINISLAMLHKINDNFYLAYNIGIDKKTWRDKPMYFWSISPKYNFTDNWQVFLEIYEDVWKNRLPHTSVDAGLSYFINDNFKVDAYAGTRINKGPFTNVKFYGIGASYRFKTKNTE